MIELSKGTLAAFMVVTAFMLQAQSFADSGSDEMADLDTVRQANSTFLETVGTRDVEAIADLWRHADYVRAIHPFRPIDEGWNEVREGFQALFKIFPEVSSAMPEPHIRVVGDVAWVSGLEEFKGMLQSGDSVSVVLRTGRIFEREGDGWLLVHHQVSPPPDE